MRSKQLSPAVAVVVVVLVLAVIGFAYWWFGEGGSRRPTETMTPGVSPYPPGYVPGGGSMSSPVTR